MPAASTDQASACAGVGVLVRNSMPAIMQRLRRIGLAAGAANLPKLFSTPPSIDTSEMNKI